MNAQQAIDEIYRAIVEVKGRGEDVVSVAALETYLANLQKHVSNVGAFDRIKFEQDLATFRAQHERNLAHYDADQKQSLEMTRAVFTYGAASLKALILTNGGAAVALLAFIGRIWTEDTGRAAAVSLTQAVAMFSFGVLAGALATVGSYFTQMCYTSDKIKLGIGLHILTAIIGLSGFALFGVGAFEAYSAFAQHLVLPATSN